MDAPAVETPDPKATPETVHMNPKERASQAPTVDQYAAARYAKKKRRRKTHRAALRRSHTNG
jgi:hypothetical protein